MNDIKKIASFSVNHEKLEPGLYVSRRDALGACTAITYDLRFKKPNTEPVLDNPALHAIEHLGATFLRNPNLWQAQLAKFKDKVIYFGPMGCRTGFYLILFDDAPIEDVVLLVKEMLAWCLQADSIPGASSIECGNYLDLNLNMAKYEAAKYLNILQNNLKTVYES